MEQSSDETGPFGVGGVAGIANQRSPFSVAETVERLTGAIDQAGATLFAVVDHSGEAQRVGMTLRDTKLLIFGNPKGGTPVMQASPLAALDLPLKVLIWADDSGTVWMSYLTGEWLAERHGVEPDLARPLSAVASLAARIAQAG